MTDKEKQRELIIEIMKADEESGLYDEPARKQTAVDYLFEQLWDTPKDKFIWHTILEKAKEMEKEQIKEAYLDSSKETCLTYGENPPHDDPKFAELYYKKTYEENEEGN